MAAAASAPTPPSTRNPWILSAGLDGVFIVGAPLVILPVLFLLSEWLSPAAVAAFVLVTLSTAHHLPGFLRVYGDPVLFERYRMRFVVMPPLVWLCVFWLAWNRLATVLLVSLVWAIWHGLMQVYGVMRIYAVKAGERSSTTPKLDRSMCLVGFAAVLLSGGLVKDRVVAAAEGTGLFGASVLLGDAAFEIVAVGFGVLAVAYVIHHAHRFVKGRPVSVLKLVTLGISLAYVYFCWAVAGRNLILGLAAFEAFHDIQYMAVAWAYNRRLVEHGDGNRLLNVLFRPGMLLAIFYVFLITAYGGIAFTTGELSQSALADHVLVTALAAFVATSGLLHFYFDGFIWKVRQPKTQRDLGIETQASGVSQTQTGFPEFTRRRELLQLGLVLAPLLLLGVLAQQRDAVEIPVRSILVRLLPGNAELHLQLGAAQQRRGRNAEAAAAYRRAVEADPELALARHGLGSMYAQQGRVAEAMQELRMALALEPTRLASAVVLGNLLIEAGELDEAEQVLRGALGHAPDNPGLSEALARVILADSSDPARSAEAAQLALLASQAENFPRAPALVTLATAVAAQGDHERAIALLRTARGLPETEGNPELRRRIVALLTTYLAASETDP